MNRPRLLLKSFVLLSSLSLASGFLLVRCTGHWPWQERAPRTPATPAAPAPAKPASPSSPLPAPARHARPDSRRHLHVRSRSRQVVKASLKLVRCLLLRLRQARLNSPIRTARDGDVRHAYFSRNQSWSRHAAFGPGSCNASGDSAGGAGSSELSPWIPCSPDRPSLPWSAGDDHRTRAHRKAAQSGSRYCLL